MFYLKFQFHLKATPNIKKKTFLLWSEAEWLVIRDKWRHLCWAQPAGGRQPDELARLCDSRGTAASVGAPGVLCSVWSGICGVCVFFSFGFEGCHLLPNSITSQSFPPFFFTVRSVFVCTFGWFSGWMRGGSFSTLQISILCFKWSLLVSPTSNLVWVLGLGQSGRGYATFPIMPFYTLTIL